LARAGTGEGCNSILSRLIWFCCRETNPYFKDEDTEELKKLLARKDLTPNEVIDFYKSKVPNLEETFGNFILEFKKMFLLMVYNGKIKELESKIPSIQDEDINTMETNTLKSWKQILEFAKRDDWDKAQQVLAVIPR